jgi:hypothetical protein
MDNDIARHDDGVMRGTLPRKCTDSQLTELTANSTETVETSCWQTTNETGWHLPSRTNVSSWNLASCQSTGPRTPQLGNV